jgi:hypothetical protein
VKATLSRRNVIGRFQDLSFDEVRLVHFPDRERTFSGGNKRRRPKRRGHDLD